MTSGDEARLSAADGETLEALFDYVEAQGWCPMPDPWNRLWELLVARSRECGAPRPAPPLILAAWHEAPLLMKRVRLLDQLEWAAEYGLLDEVDRFLRALPVNEWFQGDAVPNRERSKASQPAVLLAAAIGAVRNCADAMDAQAAALLRALPALAMDERLRPTVLEWSAGLKDTAARVMFELALLQTEIGERKADVATAVQRLSNLDSTMMTVLDASADVLSKLEAAAERDEEHEPAFALVMQAVREMLRKFGTARAATGVVSLEAPTAPRPPAAPPPVRVAADGSLVVVEVGAEGGSLTLIGREGEGGAWRFARITIDQTEALFGETDVPSTAPDLTTLVWVDSWEAGLSLMDRYPWVRLSPQYVHPDFVERVKTAIEERLRDVDPDGAERVRGRWEWRFEQAR
jgi:hypothetical protein